MRPPDRSISPLSFPLARRFALALALMLAASFARAQSGPELAVTLGSNARSGFTAGEPLVVHIWLSALDVPVSKELRISTATKRWTDAISFVVRDSGNNELSATPSIASPANTGTIFLSSRRRATATWRWSMAQTQAFPPGHYEIVARLRCGLTPNGGQTIESAPVALEVRAWSGSSAPDETARHNIALAQGCLDEGDVNQAATLIGNVLSQSPDNDRALVMRARIEEKQGDLVAALADVSHALQQLEKNQPGATSLVTVEYQTHLMNRLLGNDDSTPVPTATASAQSPVTASTTEKSPATAAGRTPKPRPVRNSNPQVNGVVIKPAGTSFAGMWMTSFGKVMISEFDGKFVTYNHDKLGMVQGTVSGDTARGTWKQLNVGGQVLLKLSADGKTFSGAYTNGTEEPVLGRSPAWDGTRSR